MKNKTTITDGIEYCNTCDYCLDSCKCESVVAREFTFEAKPVNDENIDLSKAELINQSLFWENSNIKSLIKIEKLKEKISERNDYVEALNSCIDIQKEFIKTKCSIHEYYEWCTRRLQREK